MKLIPFEQSGFIFETDAGFRLAIDIAVRTPLEKLDGLSVDAMLVSHIHPDHFSLDHIRKLAPPKLYLNRECIDLCGEEPLASEIVEVKVGDSADIGGISVSFFDVDHGPNATVRPKENFGFLFKADGESVYFAGDMYYPSGMDVSNLEVDRALIPVGDFYTFDPARALDFVKTFKHIGAVTPMHDRGKQEMKDEFQRLAEDAGFQTDRLGEK